MRHQGSGSASPLDPPAGQRRQEVHAEHVHVAERLPRCAPRVRALDRADLSRSARPRWTWTVPLAVCTIAGKPLRGSIPARRAVSPRCWSWWRRCRPGSAPVAVELAHRPRNGRPSDCLMRSVLAGLHDHRAAAARLVQHALAESAMKSSFSVKRRRPPGRSAPSRRTSSGPGRSAPAHHEGARDEHQHRHQVDEISRLVAVVHSAISIPS
jgi:hypothetical protein